eukprot:917109-Rhodomonas_salina.3
MGQIDGSLVGEGETEQEERSDIELNPVWKQASESSNDLAVHAGAFSDKLGGLRSELDSMEAVLRAVDEAFIPTPPLNNLDPNDRNPGVVLAANAGPGVSASAEEQELPSTHEFVAVERWQAGEEAPPADFGGSPAKNPGDQENCPAAAASDIADMMTAGAAQSAFVEEAKPVFSDDDLAEYITGKAELKEVPSPSLRTHSWPHCVPLFYVIVCVFCLFLSLDI